MKTRRQGASALLPPGTDRTAAGASSFRVTRFARLRARLAAASVLAGAGLVALGLSVTGLGSATEAEADTVRRPLSRLVGDVDPVAALGPRLRTDVHPPPPTATSTPTATAEPPAPPTQRVETVGQRHRFSPFTTWPGAGPITGIYAEQRGSRVHAGLDLDGVSGDFIVAAGDGVVLGTGYLEKFGGYGIVVLIEHSGGLRTLSAHLSEATVLPGDRVKAGQLVGKLGNTGHSTGSHLHFEVHLNDHFLDPLDWLPAEDRETVDHLIGVVG